MGLFKKLKKAVKKLPSRVVKTVTSPAKLTTAIGTGGLSVLAPKLTKPIESAVKSTLYNPKLALAVASLTPQGRAISAVGAQPMAFNVGGFLGAVGNVLGSVQGANAAPLRGLGTVATIAGASIAPKQNNALKPTPLPSVQRSATTALSNLGSVSIPATVATNGQWLLNRLGVRVASAASFLPALKKALGAIATFARHTPTGSIVSVLMGMGMGITAANELVAWYATKRKRRRMNAANGKALNRAARRIKAFHRMCQHTDLIKTQRRAPVRYGKACGSCRRNPCAC